MADAGIVVCDVDVPYTKGGDEYVATTVYPDRVRIEYVPSSNLAPLTLRKRTGEVSEISIESPVEYQSIRYEASLSSTSDPKFDFKRGRNIFSCKCSAHA